MKAGNIVPFEPDDLFELKKWLINEEVHKNLYVLYHPMAISELRHWYEMEKSNGTHIFKNTDRKEQMTGMGLIHYIHTKNRCAELSLIINPDFFGKGYGRNMTTYLISYSFNILNLHKVFLHTTEFNKRMISLVKSLKFSPEGIFRKELYYSGKYYDIYRFGLLDTEYVRD